MRVVVIEDEPALLAQLARRMREEGWRVDTSRDGHDGLYQLLEYPADLAVVDLGLPGLSGLEVIRQLRAQQRRVPVLILTARGQWQEKVEGLEAGADDYLVKPFHIEELMARLKALARRAAGAVSARLDFGPLVIDTDAQAVSLDGRTITLTAFEYLLLEQLSRHAGQVISKQTLSDYLYPHDEDRDSNVIEVLIARLRRKLDPNDNERFIETLRGRGYRFKSFTAGSDDSLSSA